MAEKTKKKSATQLTRESQIIIEHVFRVFHSSCNCAEDKRRWNECTEPTLGLIDRLDRYKPTKPDDDTEGFLAITVGKNKSRMKNKTGRFLGTKLKLSDWLSDETIRALADKINLTLWNEPKVRLDTGKQIRLNYLHGVGSHSCMTGNESNRQKRVSFYEINPDRFSMLVMTMGKDSARALVHKLDNGRHLLDRIFYSTSSLVEKMQEYGRKQGWILRGEYEGVNMNDLIVSGLNFVQGNLPYADTLYEYNIKKGKLNIFHPSAKYKSFGSLQTGGGIINLHSNVCRACGMEIDLDDEDDIVHQVEGYWYCEDCFGDRFTTCEDCEEIVSRDDTCRTANDKYVCNSCLIDYYSSCDDCQEYFDKENSPLNDIGGDKYVCDDCLSEYTKCSQCGDYFGDDDMVGSILFDGVFYCTTCYDRTKEETEKKKQEESQADNEQE
jgi:hypothetical protein